SRSKASASASVPSSSATSSYSARAWPISFWAMDEKATSSSRKGAMPVHSELRQPRTSSSSAMGRSRSARSGAGTLTRLLQLHLERVAVHAAIARVEARREILDRLDRVARHDPHGLRLVAAPVEVARVHVGEALVGRLERAGVHEGLARALLSEDLEDQAASAGTTRRTQAVSSREVRRKPRRSSVFGPWPVTTLLSSSQSGSVYSH